MNLAQRSSNDLFKVTAENQGRSQSRNSGVSSPICNPLDHPDFAICQWDECSVLLSVLTNPFWHGFPSFGRAGAATEQRAGPALPQPLARPAPSRACVWVKLPVPFTAGTASVARAGTPSFRNASPPKIPPRQGWRFIVTCPAEWHERSHPSSRYSVRCYRMQRKTHGTVKQELGCAAYKLRYICINTSIGRTDLDSNKFSNSL